MELSTVIYEHFSSQEIAREIPYDKSKQFDVNNNSFQICINDIQQKIKIKLNTGKCSKILIHQLANHKCQLGEKFGNKIEYYNPSEICDLIELIENDKRKGKLFHGEILKGFQKIHHSTYCSLGYSVIRNIKEFWFQNKKIKKERLEEYINITQKHGEHHLSAIMNEMHTIAIHDKVKKDELKGEWLIYKEQNNCIYYLCLASHKEGDKLIYQNKILACLIEFPELK